MAASDARGSLRFTRIKLTNWRNFTDATAPLGERAFLVGANASGKSNLLDVLRFLRDIAAVGGGFQAAVEARGGVSRLRSLAVDPRDVVYRREAGTAPPMPPCGRS